MKQKMEILEKQLSFCKAKLHGIVEGLAGSMPGGDRGENPRRAGMVGHAEGVTDLAADVVNLIELVETALFNSSAGEACTVKSNPELPPGSNYAGGRIGRG